MPARAPDAIDVGRGRSRATANLLRMGHCAPSVAQTLAELGGARDPFPVRLAAGLPGGIGNTRMECGCVTAPLVALGLRYRDSVRDGLPVVLSKGHAFCDRFRACHGSLLCRDILGSARIPLRCIPVVRRTPELHGETVAAGAGALPRATRDAYRRLHAHLGAKGFHCAHAVLERLRDAIPVTPELLDATEAFAGGTLYLGMTCSALAAGVMAIGLARGEIEDSRLRVLRMIALMAVGGRALDDDVNAFNRPMRLGHALARAFERAHGSTQCRAITGCDFSDDAGVERYVASGQVARCEEIAATVAGEVRAVLAGTAAARH